MRSNSSQRGLVVIDSILGVTLMVGTLVMVAAGISQNYRIRQGIRHQQESLAFESNFRQVVARKFEAAVFNGSCNLTDILDVTILGNGFTYEPALCPSGSEMHFCGRIVAPAESMGDIEVEGQYGVRDLSSGQEVACSGLNAKGLFQSVLKYSFRWTQGGTAHVKNNTHLQTVLPFQQETRGGFAVSDPFLHIVYVDTDSDGQLNKVIRVAGLPQKRLFPLVGDWDGDGVSEIAFYDDAGKLFIRRTLSDGPVEETVSWSLPSGWRIFSVPSEGGDGVGFFNPTNRTFHIKSSLGDSDFSAVFEITSPMNSSLVPFAGKWTENSVRAGVGLYDDNDRKFCLKNDWTTGACDELVPVDSSAPSLPVVGLFSTAATTTMLARYDASSSDVCILNSYSESDGCATQHHLGANNAKFYPLFGVWRAN